MTPYLHQLQTFFDSHADPTQAAPMAAYMRHQFAFLGLKTPAKKALFKAFVAEHGLPALDQLEATVRELWSWPQREYQYIALTFLDRYQRQLTPAALPLLEYLITHRSWWDTVDSLASHNVGRLLAQHPACRGATIDRWRRADNLWLRRTTLLFQLGYKGNTDPALLFALVEENCASPEFFLQKAIGWALREYSKTDPAAVRAFVEGAPLAALSRREALKWLKARGQL